MVGVAMVEAAVPLDRLGVRVRPPTIEWSSKRYRRFAPDAMRRALSKGVADDYADEE